MTSRSTARTHTQAYKCEICGKSTSRLFGLAASISDTDREDERLHIFVLGYCALHRDEVAPHYRRHLEQTGEVTWFADYPTELRPREVTAWLEHTDRAFAADAKDWSGTPGPTYQEMRPEEAATTDCPHCGSRLSWGTGPHVDDANRRGNAVAWECLDCGAAGLLTNVRPQ